MDAVVGNGALDFGIDLDLWPWIWLSVAVIFALVELAVIGGTFVLLPYALSAFVAALLAFYDVSIEIQWATFVGGGTLLLLGLVRWIRGFLAENKLPVGVGADRLVGTTAIVTAAVEPDDVARLGRVSVDGELWGALSNDAASHPVGSSVRIVAVVGTRVMIEAIGSDTPGTDSRRESAE